MGSMLVLTCPVCEGNGEMLGRVEMIDCGECLGTGAVAFEK